MPLGDGPAADEPLGHALAALDARWVFLAEKAVAGHEERLRRFAGVFALSPPGRRSPSDAQADPNPKPFGVAVRRMSDDAQTFLEIANDSPYPIRLAGVLDAPASAAVDDLGRGLRLSPVPEAGGRNLVLDLLPYGVAAIRVGAPRVQLSVGDALSLRGRADQHAGAIQRAVGPTGAAQSRPCRDPGRTAESGFRARSSIPIASVAASEPVAKASSSGAGTADRERRPSVVPAGWRLEANHGGLEHDRDRSGEPALGAREPEADRAHGSGVGGERAIRAERPIQPDDPGFLPGVRGRRQGSRLDRRGIGRTAVRPAHRAECLHRMGGAGGACLGHARRGARLGPAAVRAADAGHPLDRRSAHPGARRPRSRRGSTPSTRCWRPCRPIANSATPTSRGWPGRTGSDESSTAADRPAGTNERPAAEAGATRSTDAAASALPPERKLR